MGRRARTLVAGRNGRFMQFALHKSARCHALSAAEEEQHRKQNNRNGRRSGHLLTS